jgi:hypothetical protein
MTTINPILLAKLHWLRSKYFELWLQVPLYKFPTFNQFQDPAINNPFAAYGKSYEDSLKDLVETDDTDSGGTGGGGGTMKGLRVEKTPPMKR